MYPGASQTTLSGLEISSHRPLSIPLAEEWDCLRLHTWWVKPPILLPAPEQWQCPSRSRLACFGRAVLQSQPGVGTSPSPQPESPPDCIRKGSTISCGEGQLPALLQHLHLCFPTLLTAVPGPIWSPRRNCEMSGRSETSPRLSSPSFTAAREIGLGWPHQTPALPSLCCLTPCLTPSPAVCM